MQLIRILVPNASLAHPPTKQVIEQIKVLTNINALPRGIPTADPVTIELQGDEATLKTLTEAGFNAFFPTNLWLSIPAKNLELSPTNDLTHKLKELLGINIKSDGEILETVAGPLTMMLEGDRKWVDVLRDKGFQARLA